ncbi:hypothetical protein V6N13_063785 [Hibiscus sabdariffa]
MYTISDLSLQVCNATDGHGNWDVDFMRQHFDANTILHILAIPAPYMEAFSDFLAYRWEEEKLCTVKSIY